MPESFVAGAIAGYGIAIPVGPVAVLIIELGVRRGFRLAAPAGLGAATADGLYALLAVVAGAAIAQLLEPITPALQVIAVVVLTVIALRGFWAALYHARIRIPGNAELPARPGRTYLRFLAITLLNPTTILYFAALILGRPELGSGPAERTAFIVGAALASTSWQLFLALLGSLFHQRLPWQVQVGISVLGNAVVLGFAIVIARGI
ncbi:MAG TPA: LysE family transporter [Candidatus Limnocylindrales bacterium]|nr:LysE family transporter [Candidatus Limnocylindrales bacterium]